MRIELRLPNPEGRIPAGMLGEVVLKVPRAVPAVLVPVSAVAQDANGAQVAVVGGDALLQFRKVVLGRNLGNEAEVLSGLKPGEQVVLAPNAMLVAGQKVGAKVNAPAKK
jgi:multidrug efflux pump subunit AcrA (membrane-fusion protein)